MVDIFSLIQDLALLDSHALLHSKCWTISLSKLVIIYCWKSGSRSRGHFYFHLFRSTLYNLGQHCFFGVNIFDWPILCSLSSQSDGLSLFTWNESEIRQWLILTPLRLFSWLIKKQKNQNVLLIFIFQDCGINKTYSEVSSFEFTLNFFWHFKNWCLTWTFGNGKNISYVNSRNAFSKTFFKLDANEITFHLQCMNKLSTFLWTLTNICTTH